MIKRVISNIYEKLLEEKAIGPVVLCFLVILTRLFDKFHIHIMVLLCEAMIVLVSVSIIYMIYKDARSLLKEEGE